MISGTINILNIMDVDALISDARASFLCNSGLVFLSPFWPVASNSNYKDQWSLPVCLQRKRINEWQQKFLFMLFSLLASFGKMLHEKVLVWTWNYSLLFCRFLCCAKHQGRYECCLHFSVRLLIRCMALQQNIVLCLSFYLGFWGGFLFVLVV